jgi:hypothetical protein
VSRPASEVVTPVAIDVVVLTLDERDADGRPGPLRVLATEREQHDAALCWTLPGGRLGRTEPLEGAVERMLAGAAPAGARPLAPRHLEQLATFGGVDRDPRGRVVSVSYLGLLPAPVAVAPSAAWLPAEGHPPLAYDHDAIVAAGVARLRSKLRYSNVAYGLLPGAFTLSELQEVYEAVLGRALDKRNFRRTVGGAGMVAETDEVRRGPHRPARLYRFAAPELVLLEEPVSL